MAKHTLKILHREQGKIFKVCLVIFQHYYVIIIIDYFAKERNSFMNNSTFKSIIIDRINTLLMREGSAWRNWKDLNARANNSFKYLTQSKTYVEA